MIYFLISLLFVLTLVSGGLTSIIRQPKYTQLLLIFAGSYLFSVLVSHLLPMLHSVGLPAEGMGIWVVIGFFFQYLLEGFSLGIEHGHLEDNLKQHTNHSHDKTLPLATMSIALLLHAFLEGLVIGFSATQTSLYSSIYLGVILHKLPAAFAWGTLLKSRTVKQHVFWILMVSFALSSPLGMLISGQVTLWMPSEVLGVLQAFVMGNLLHIATTIFFENTPRHLHDKPKILMLVLGVVLALLTTIGH